MQYIGNDTYEFNFINGTIKLTKEELMDSIREIEKYENNGRDEVVINNSEIEKDIKRELIQNNESLFNEEFIDNKFIMEIVDENIELSLLHTEDFYRNNFILVEKY